MLQSRTYRPGLRLRCQSRTVFGWSSSRMLTVRCSIASSSTVRLSGLSGTRAPSARTRMSSCMSGPPLRTRKTTLPAEMRLGASMAKSATLTPIGFPPGCAASSRDDEHATARRASAITPRCAAPGGRYDFTCASSAPARRSLISLAPISRGPAGRRASCGRLLGLVPIEHALGAVELAGHVVGVVVHLPGREPQRVVRDVCPKHARLDARGLDDVPDRLIVPVEVVREPDEIEAGIAAARALPVDDPGEGAVVAREDVVG